MAIYMAYDDSSIKGDVSDANYTGWIELSSFQWGIGRGITSPDTGSESDREGSKPSVSEIVVTKSEDSASPNLMRAACGADPVGEGKLVHIAFVKTDQNGSETYLQFDLENTLVSGWSMSSGGDRPTESVSLNFTKVTMTATPMGAGNDTGSPDRPFYDLAKSQGG